ncbi:MAG: tail fiber domain-containing protein [Vicingaceae bacterium]|nr:tail fiber domain-containing protein [Vicingaceae bacterium]
MKQIKKIIIGSLLSLPMISNAQFIPLPGAGRTQPAIQKIGMGFFPNTGSINAKLHVSQFLLANNPATDGFLFRTDGSSTVANSWQLFTGVATGSVTEKFKLFVSANSNDATLQTTQNGIMRFNTNGINRMTVFGNGILNTDGRIAMGNDLPLGFTPTARLHLHHTEPTLGLVNTTTKYTDLSTGFGNNDGFEVGYSSSSTIAFSNFAQLRNRENTPMKFFTTNRERIHVNADRTVTLDGYNVPTNGFVGIGNPSQGGILPGLWDQRGPFSLLHLNGRTGLNSFVFAGGYRPWMRTGITFSDQIDLGYVGLRSVFPPGNINEMVINMSNDPAPGFGPDDIVFRFSVAGNGNTTIDDDFDAYNDLDGRHLARFTGSGDFGLGPVFGVVQSNANYVRPASLQHLSLMKLRSVYTQYTNRDDLINTGTGETAADGLRIGIHGNNNINMNGNALIYNQETRHLLFSTGVNTNAVNINNGITFERMRITSVGAPTNLANGGYGTNNPGNINSNFTRVAISQNPAQPITRPLSLLHLGFNTGAVGGGTTDGWRNWMDIGTFTSNSTDNMYVGLKREAGGVPGIDRFDAVINWGDNSGVNPLNGPDNLRFIFTETTTGTIPGNAPATSNEGLEVARFDPRRASTLTGVNFGMMGIGDFSPTGPNTAVLDVVDAKLDIDGDLRIREVTEDTTLLQVLVIDSNDHNRVHWRSISNFGGTCNSSSVIPLASSWEIKLGGNTYNFSDKGAVNITHFTTCNQLSKLLVDDDLFGVTSIVRNSTNTPGNIAGMFIGSSASKVHALVVPFDGGNVGFGTISPNPTYRLEVFGGSNFNGSIFHNGNFILSDQQFKTNVEDIKSATAILKKLKPHTYKMDTVNFPQFNFEERLQYGFIAQEVEGVLPNLVHESYMTDKLDSLGNIIYPAVNYKSLNYNALIPITVQAVNEINAKIDKSTLSDQTVKTNVQTLNGSLAKVKQMRGVSYAWSTSAQNNMELDSLEHIGFIAQEVAAVEPLLTFVDDSSLVHVNYDRVAPLLVESVKELDEKIIAKDSIINDLEARLAYLEACIESANICAGNNRTTNNEPTNYRATQSVKLENLNAIILDQNLPNPFAESTQINYVLPDDVMNAKMLFYDMNGRIINEVNINERGNGTLTVYGENLEKGIYTYSLIADGKLIATKKMVKK